MDLPNLGQTFPWLLLGAGEYALRPVDLLQSALSAPFCCMQESSFANKADQNRQSSIVSHVFMRASLVRF